MLNRLLRLYISSLKWKKHKKRPKNLKKWCLKQYIRSKMGTAALINIRRKPVTTISQYISRYDSSSSEECHFALLHFLLLTLHLLVITRCLVNIRMHRKRTSGKKVRRSKCYIWHFGAEIKFANSLSITLITVQLETNKLVPGAFGRI